MNTPITYQGRDYLMCQGRIILDWHDRPTLWHAEGCLLCCTFRVGVRLGSQGRHPGESCPNCGTRWKSNRPDPCAYCARTAHFTDDHGRPVHKVCLELALTADLLTPATNTLGRAA